MNINDELRAQLRATAARSEAETDPRDTRIAELEAERDRWESCALQFDAEADMWIARRNRYQAAWASAYGRAIRRDARIAELEGELADALPALRAEQRKTARAEARLAAVIALCDGDLLGGPRVWATEIRAAAAGDTT